MDKVRYTYQDDFEMLMIRHDYLTKVQNPDPNWIKKFEPIVNTTASLMYGKLGINFSKVGYDIEDVKMITNCYMIGYMGLYSIERNEKEKDKILKSFFGRFDREPTELELEKKERTNLISFLRQRLQHASDVCARKARNITVGSDRRVTYAFTKDSVPASDGLILEKGEKLGYRKVTKNELKDIRLQARINMSKDLYDVSGFKVIQIQELDSGIKEYDYKHLFIDEKTDAYNSNPEELYLDKEKDIDLALMKEEFEGLNAESKKNTLSNFINAFKGNIKYKDEISIARKMLKEFKSMV